MHVTQLEFQAHTSTNITIHYFFQSELSRTTLQQSRIKYQRGRLRFVPPTGIFISMTAFPEFPVLTLY